MEITCYREQELMREGRHLPAATYNLAITLLSRSASGYIFLPIRSMQYLAILDSSEFVFIDGEKKKLIDVAWQRFHPQQRETLKDPVAYDAVYYFPHSQALMSRMQGELHKALLEAASKVKIESPAKVIKFEIKR